MVKQIKPILFQINCSGDFLRQSIYDAWVKIAVNNPLVKFLAYTKSYGLDYSFRPSNFKTILSVYPSLDEPVSNMPKAYLTHPLEDRIPDNIFSVCNNCDNTKRCGKCWGLLDGESVVLSFEK